MNALAHSRIMQVAIFLTATWLCFAGCSDNSDRSNIAGSAPLLIEPNVRVGNIRGGMTVSEVTKELGEPPRRTATSLEYPALGLAVIPNSEGIVQGIMCGDVTGTNGPFAKAFKGGTKEGIGMNSTRDELLKAYGQPSQVEKLRGGLESLKYENLGMTFTLEGGRVHHVIVRLSGPSGPDRTVTLEPPTK